MAKAGRPGKWNTPETKERLQELVYRYKQENPYTEVIIADMVKFTIKLHKEYPEEFPDIYDRFTWKAYGEEYILQANRNLETKTIKTELKEYENIEMPNYIALVEKYYSNKEKLVEKIAACEVSHHLILERFIEAEKERLVLKDKIKSLEKDLKNFQNLINEVAHLSKSEPLRKKFGLNNIISPNANSENKKAMRNLDNLKSFLEPTEENENIQQSSTEQNNNPIKERWKKLKNEFNFVST